MLTLKICVGVFSGIFEARMLKLGIHMDNELLYCSIENGTPCSYSSLYLSIFLYLMAYLCHSFLRNCISSSNMVHICRMSDCIEGLRLMVMAHIFLFLARLDEVQKSLCTTPGVGVSVHIYVKVFLMAYIFQIT